MFYILEKDEYDFINSINTIEEDNKGNFKSDRNIILDELPFEESEFWTNDIPKYKLIDGELIEATHPDTDKIILEREIETILEYLRTTDYVVTKLQENQLVPFLSEEEVISYTNTLTNRQGKRQRMTQIDIELGE